MRIAVRVDRDEALRAGRDAHGWVVVEVPAESLSPEDREEVIRASQWHGVRQETKDLLSADYYLIPRTQIAWADLEAIQRVCAESRRHREEEEAEEAAREERERLEHEEHVRLSAELSREIERLGIDGLLALRESGCWLTAGETVGIQRTSLRPGESYAPIPHGHWPTYPAVSDAATTICREAARILAEREDAKRATAVAEAEAAEARRLVVLGEAVQRLGTESQRERWEAGVLVHREVIGLLWQEAFSGLTQAGLTVLVDQRHCNPGSYSALDALTEEEWAVVKQIKAWEGWERVVGTILPDDVERKHVDGFAVEYSTAKVEDWDTGECARRRLAYAEITIDHQGIDLSADVVLSDEIVESDE